MKMSIEKLDALHDIAKHHGINALFELMDDAINDILKESLTIGLDSDPQKASMQLYAVRMRCEGAKKLRIILKNKMDGYKQGGIR